MNPYLILVLAQIVDVLVVAVTKRPELAPHLGTTIANILPALSQAAGETPEQTAGRRAAAEAIFAKQSEPIGVTASPPPPVTILHVIKGTVTLNGAAFPDVEIVTSPVAVSLAFSGPSGAFTSSPVADGVYTIKPEFDGYTFSPTERIVTVAGADVGGQDFRAAVGD